MVQRTVVQHLSDLSGKPDAEQVRFEYQLGDKTPSAFQIDLTRDEVEGFIKAISKYTEAGTKLSGRGRRGRGTSASSSRESREELARLRAWARENGYEVSDRGRVSARVRDAYARSESGAAALTFEVPDTNAADELKVVGDELKSAGKAVKRKAQEIFNAPK